MRALAGSLLGVVVVLAVMGIAHSSQTTLIVCVICSGAFFGINNTLMTQVVMESAPVARPIASSSYSFVRFCGGAIAPFLAGKIAEHVSVQAPFYFGAGMTAIAIGSLWFYRSSLVAVAEPAPAVLPIESAIEETEERARPADEHGTLVLAVGGPSARRVCAMSVPLARAHATTVHVLHVIERDIIAGEDTIDVESEAAANDLLDACVAELREAGVPVFGELLHSVGTHADVAERILKRARQLAASTIVLGPDSHHGPLAARVSAEIASKAPTHVIVLNPDAGPLVVA